ncbi:hypothetical protein FS819_028950 (plasmid) [Allorhizobium sp. Av2]|nr:hypothetical protein [Allorhizobium sp. Av2]
MNKKESDARFIELVKRSLLAMLSTLPTLGVTTLAVIAIFGMSGGAWWGILLIVAVLSHGAWLAKGVCNSVMNCFARRNREPELF